ncbi:putative reverse transcriptase domain-containing protein [Tanacetum coccineum]
MSLVGPAGDPWDQRVRSQLIGKDLVSGLLVYEFPLSSLRKKYHLSLKNEMPPRDKPKIDDKGSFELKGQFLKELRDNTFSGSNHEDANKHIEKFLEIVDLFHIPNITQDQVMLRAFPMSLIGAASHWLGNKPSGLITTWEDLKTKFLSKYCPLAHTAKKMDGINNFLQEPDETLYQAWKYLSKKWLNTLKNATMEHLGQEVLKLLTAWQPYKHNLIILEEKSRRKKVKPSKKLNKLNLVDLSKEEDIEQQLQDSTRGTMQTLRASVSVMPLSTYLNLGLGELAHTKLTVELADRTMKYPKGIAENVLVGIGKFVFPIDFIILDMPKDVKVLLILESPFLSTAHTKIDVFKRKITLRVGDEKIIFKSVKLASSLIKRVYMLSLRERMELDLEARLIGETLVLNRPLDPLYGDYIELNDFNVPLELRRDQVDDLMLTIEEREWKIWMATEIKTWEILFLENRSAKLHVWKQEGLMD